MIDAHIHFGQYYEKYYKPIEVIEALYNNGITKIVCSSTTICGENIGYYDIISEISELTEYTKTKNMAACILFWVNPKLGFEERYFFEANYSGFKIHPRAHNWDLNDKKTEKLCHKIFEYASKVKIPVLIHTGYDKIDEAKKFEIFFKIYSDVNFILAHGRPFNQIAKLLKKYNNLFIDTAFMPNENVIELIKLNFLDRIIFGTDFPIADYYSQSKNINLSKQYKDTIELVKLNLIDHFDILQENANKVYFKD